MMLRLEAGLGRVTDNCEAQQMMPVLLRDCFVEMDLSRLISERHVMTEQMEMMLMDVMIYVK